MSRTTQSPPPSPESSPESPLEVCAHHDALSALFGEGHRATDDELAAPPTTWGDDENTGLADIVAIAQKYPEFRLDTPARAARGTAPTLPLGGSLILKPSRVTPASRRRKQFPIVVLTAIAAALVGLGALFVAA